MTRAPILFRVDGTRPTGTESLWRSLTYAAALQRRRRPTYFLSQLDPPSMALTIRRAGHDWIPAAGPAGTSEDLGQVLQEIARLSPAAVIVDSAQIEETYLQALRATGVVVVSVDHLAQIHIPSQLIINPLLGLGKESYSFPMGTQLLLGTRYTLVRPEIRRIRPIRAQEPAQPFRVLVALGDHDPHEQSAELAKLLLNTPKVGRVDIAVRPYSPHLESLQELAATCPDRLEIAVEPAEISARIVRSHLAITAGNGWSLELACVGIPQLIIVQNEGHWPTAQRLEEEGAANCLGWYENVSPATIRQSVQSILADVLERQTMSRCGRQLIDGRGPDRLVTALEVMLHRDRRVPLAQAAAA